jgi:hypothetical protein
MVSGRSCRSPTGSASSRRAPRIRGNQRFHSLAVCLRDVSASLQHRAARRSGAAAMYSAAHRCIAGASPLSRPSCSARTIPRPPEDFPLASPGPWVVRSRPRQPQATGGSQQQANWISKSLHWGKRRFQEFTELSTRWHEKSRSPDRDVPLRRQDSCAALGIARMSRVAPSAPTGPVCGPDSCCRTSRLRALRRRYCQC